MCGKKKVIIYQIVYLFRFSRLRQRAHGEWDLSAEDVHSSITPDPTSKSCKGRVCSAPDFLFPFVLLSLKTIRYYHISLAHLEIQNIHRFKETK